MTLDEFKDLCKDLGLNLPNDYLYIKVQTFYEETLKSLEEAGVMWSMKQLIEHHREDKRGVSGVDGG